MKLDEFEIGADFFMSGHRWRCTDIGTRTVAAILLAPEWGAGPDVDWRAGPPYALSEEVLDEYDLPACSRDTDSFRLQLCLPLAM